MEDKYYELKDVIEDLETALSNCESKYYRGLIQEIINEMQKEVDEIEEELEKEEQKFKQNQESEYWQSQF